MWQLHSSIYCESMIFRKLLLRPRTRRNAGDSLPLQESRFPHLPLLLRPSLLHTWTYSLPIPHFTLLPPPPFSTLFRSRTPHLSSPMSSLTTRPSDSTPSPSKTVSPLLILFYFLIIKRKLCKLLSFSMGTGKGCDKRESARGFLQGLDCAECHGFGAQGMGSEPEGWLCGGPVFWTSGQG